MDNEVFKKAVQAAGGPSAMAKALEVSRQFVTQMEKGVRPVPPNRCLAIARASGGEVTPQQLRPDVFGEIEPTAVA